VLVDEGASAPNTTVPCFSVHKTLKQGTTLIDTRNMILLGDVLVVQQPHITQDSAQPVDSVVLTGFIWPVVFM
jgi:hypothetical protein